MFSIWYLFSNILSAILYIFLYCILCIKSNVKVNITFDQSTAEPAENVTLQISTDPFSLVSLLAVDQSVLLLATGNDVTQEDVRRSLFKFYFAYQKTD